MKKKKLKLVVALAVKVIIYISDYWTKHRHGACEGGPAEVGP